MPALRADRGAVPSSKFLTQGKNGPDMPLGDRHDVVAIPSADRARERQAARQRQIGDQPIARDQPFLADRQAPQPIAGKGIDTRLIEDQLRCMLFEKGDQRRLSRSR